MRSIPFQSFGNNDNSNSFPSSGFFDGGVNTDDKDLSVCGNDNGSASANNNSVNDTNLFSGKNNDTHCDGAWWTFIET